MPVRLTPAAEPVFSGHGAIADHLQCGHHRVPSVTTGPTLKIPPLRAAAVLTTAAFALTACGAGGGSDSPTGTPASTASEAPTGALTVFAAASLSEIFTALAAEFEDRNPGVTVSLVFDGSAGLASQITEGAPADVFASADLATMQTVVDAGAAEDPEVFVSNVLEIATTPGNPAGIASFADLADPALVLVVCAPEVPCGAATAAVETLTGIELHPVSEENSVTDVLGKVVSGEADAGLVYATDVLAAGGAVAGVPFAEAGSAVNDYPIAAVTGARQPELAAAFVAFVLSADAQAQLAAAGFRPAP